MKYVNAPLKVSEAKKSYWPDINVNFLSAKNVLNFRMTRADVLNHNSTPHTLEKRGGYMENDRDYLMELPSTYTGTYAAQLNHIP